MKLSCQYVGAFPAVFFREPPERLGFALCRDRAGFEADDRVRAPLIAQRSTAVFFSGEGDGERARETLFHKLLGVLCAVALRRQHEQNVSTFWGLRLWVDE